MTLSSDALLTPARLAATLIPGFSFPNHVQAFQRHTMRLFSDPTYNRLIVECMVRAGKSWWFSYIVPCWLLMALPGRHIIIVAHNEDLAGDFVARIRDFIRQHGHHVNRTLDPDQQSKHHIRVLGNGPASDVWGFGREGALRGRGAHYLVADDLLRDSDALTGQTLPNINSWWFKAMTRTEPGCKIAVVMSRVAPNDLSGYCLAQNAHLQPCDTWHSVKFPAIAPDGTALWPERYSIDWLHRKRKEFEDAGEGWLFDCQYMCDARANPTLIEFPRSYFDNIWYPQTQRPAIQYAYGAVDPAQGKNESGDYSVAMRMLVDVDDNYWVDDILMTRCPVTAFEEQCAEFFARNPCDAVLVESNIESGFLDHMAQIAYERYGAQIYGNKVHHTEQKETRIRKYLTPPLHQHKIHFFDKPLMRQAVSQIEGLFGGQYDDAPDTLAMCIELKKAHLGEDL